MSRRARWIIAAVAVGAVIIAILGRVAYPVYKCATWNGDHSTVEARIDACTSIIAAGWYAENTLVLAYFNRGSAYQSKNDLDRAMADFNQAIRLDPRRVLAYGYRGELWRAKGDRVRAIADFNRALAINPRFALAYQKRGYAYATNGERDRATMDFARAIMLDPTNADAYFNRGRSDLYWGALADARADLSRAHELAPQAPYAALWLDIADRRSGRPSRLAAATAQVDMTKWPAPVIRLYLDQSTPAAVLNAADDPDAETKKEQVCEANFYTGELALLQGRKNEAKRLFPLAAADCPRLFIEYDAAVAELKALGAS